MSKVKIFTLDFILYLLTKKYMYILFYVNVLSASKNPNYLIIIRFEKISRLLVKLFE